VPEEQKIPNIITNYNILHKIIVNKMFPYYYKYFTKNNHNMFLLKDIQVDNDRSTDDWQQYYILQNCD